MLITHDILRKKFKNPLTQYSIIQILKKLILNKNIRFIGTKNITLSKTC